MNTIQDAGSHVLLNGLQYQKGTISMWPAGSAGNHVIITYTSNGGLVLGLTNYQDFTLLPGNTTFGDRAALLAWADSHIYQEGGASAVSPPRTVNEAVAPASNDITLLLADGAGTVRSNKTTAHSIIIPAAADVAFEPGASIPVHVVGSAAATVTPDPAVTVGNNPPSYEIPAGSAGVLYCVSPDLWDVVVPGAGGGGGGATLGEPILVIDQLDFDQAVLSWSAPTGVTDYVVERAENSTFTLNKVNVYAGTANTVTATGLGAVTHYWFRIKGTAGAAFSNWNVADDTTPAAPTLIWDHNFQLTGAGFAATAIISGGAITGINISNGGAGYQPLTTIYFTGDGTGAFGKATVVGGVITGITMDASGAGYTAATAAVTGSLNGWTLVIDSSGGAGGPTDNGVFMHNYVGATTIYQQIPAFVNGQRFKVTMAFQSVGYPNANIYTYIDGAGDHLEEAVADHTVYTRSFILDTGTFAAPAGVISVSSAQYYNHYMELRTLKLERLN